MSAIYTKFKESLLQGDVDLALAPLKIQLVSGYTFDATDVGLADIAGAYGTAADVTVASITNARVLVQDVTFPAVTGTGPITGMVAYVAAGSNPLVCFIDRRADTVPVNITPNGGDITFSFTYLVKL